MNTFNMMKAFALTAVMTVAAISAAQPQGGPQAGPRGGGQGQMGGPGMRGPGVPPELLILNMKSVQEELKITAEQDKAIDQLTLRVMRNGGGPGGPGGGFGGPGQGGPGQGGGGQRPPFGEEGDGWFAQQGGRGQGGRGQGQGTGFGGPGQGSGPDFIGALEKILSERQMNRHHQLTLQWEAPMVFMRPEVGRKLEITEEQRSDINEIIRKFMPPPGGGPGGPGFGGQGQGGRGQGGRGQGGQRPPFEGDEENGWFAQQGGGRGQGGPGQGQNFEEMLARRKRAMTEVMTIFSDGQKRIWAEMTGSKFDKWVAPELPRPQGGPGGSGGNGGPGMPPPPPVDF